MSRGEPRSEVQFAEFSSIRQPSADPGQRAGAPVAQGVRRARVLLERRPNAVSKEELHERLWPGTFVVDANLSVTMAEVRRGTRRRSAAAALHPDRPPGWLRVLSRSPRGVRAAGRSAGSRPARLAAVERARPAPGGRARTSSVASRTASCGSTPPACRAGMHGCAFPRMLC